MFAWEVNDPLLTFRTLTTEVLGATSFLMRSYVYLAEARRWFYVLTCLLNLGSIYACLENGWGFVACLPTAAAIIYAVKAYKA